ncbi:MAG TPA: hypothetical protein VGB22_10900 [candidate division Zixibacteria bacterium]|jgi:hypothetical protein
MIALLADAAFADWLRPFVPAAADVPELPAMDCDYKCICSIATLCSFFKCIYGGGLLNSMCDACAGTSLACAIADFFI